MDDSSQCMDLQQHELAALRQQVATLKVAEAAAQAEVAAFQHTLEELRVADEELRMQHEELLATREALTQERARYAALFTLAPDGYLVTDGAGVLQEVNHAAAALLGVPADTLVGKPLVVYVARADRRAFHTHLTQLVRCPRQGPGPPWELHLQPRQGSPVPVSLTVASDPPPPAPARWLYWLVRDLTAAKQADAERQRLERAAHRAEHFALLGRLAAGVSHELRNPLGAIVLHVDLLEEELRQPAPESATAVAQALTEIKTHLARVDDLLQDYLSLIRVGAGQQTPVDLPAFVTQLAQELAPALTAQGITLQLEDLHPLGVVTLLPHPFRRALLNLVHNAMDAMPAGGTLTLGGHGQGATVRLTVRDTGSGIPPEQVPRIFEPLYTTKPGGTGLGLYLVQEVVTAQGGQVAVQSAVGAGTTVTIMLPRADAEGEV